MPNMEHSPLSCWTVALAVVLLLAPGGGQAEGPKPAAQGKADTASAETVINRAIDKALGILRDPALKSASKQRVDKLRKAVDHVFDWEAMARSSIGPHWRKLDDGQRADFVNVFKELLARQYMDDIDRFQGSEKLRVTGSEVRGAQVVVKTILITASREQVPIDYTMHRPAGQWTAEDISIEGVSMVNHYRKTFSRFLVNNDFGTLLQRLKRKLGSS